MQPNITQVEWSATNIPSGLSFDAQTGTFSGTPAESGTYTVPVHVVTNYGEDTKDITIMVGAIGNSPLKVMGEVAQLLTGDASSTPDKYGFYSIPNIPNPDHVVNLRSGFGVKTANKDWYVVGYDLKKVLKYFQECKDIEEVPQTTTMALPISDVDDIVSGNLEAEVSTGAIVTREYVMYQTTNGDINIGQFTNPSYKVSASWSYPSYVNGMISKGYGYYGEAFISHSNYDGSQQPFLSLAEWKIISRESGNVAAHTLKQILLTDADYSEIKSIWGAGGWCFCLTNSGELWQCKYSSSGSNSVLNKTNIATGLGKIKDFWITATGNEASVSFYNNNYANIFELTEDNKLYAKGNNTYYVLGLPEEKTYTDFALVGEYDVKRIEPGALLLTNDGKLYHSCKKTSYSSSDIDFGQHTEFTQIFPDYRFQDICFSSGLAVIVKDSSD